MWYTGERIQGSVPFLRRVIVVKTIELDLTGCKHPRDIHEKIREAFSFPDWYGMGWDAFRDLLWSNCDANQIRIKGEHTLDKELSDHIVLLHEILEENKRLWKDSDWQFDYMVVD